MTAEAADWGGEGEPSLRIGDVARLIGVSPSTLRAWEREGLVTPVREEGRHRRYTRQDVENLRRTRALRERGYSHRVLRRLLAHDVSPDDDLAGAKLRALRAKRGLSLRRAAATAGISIAYLSLVERGQATPTVAMLQRIAAAYGGTVLEVFGAGEGGAEERKLVRAGERRRLQGFDRVLMEDLVRFPNAALQVEIFTVQPGGGSGGGYAHEGEEAVFVLEGHVQLWLDDVERYDLEPGDTLYFHSMQRHRWHNPGVTPARLFWVNTPPTF